MKIKSIKTEKQYIKAINHLEKLGDNPDYVKNQVLQVEFLRIEKLIELYDKKHYPL